MAKTFNYILGAVVIALIAIVIVVSLMLKSERKKHDQCKIDLYACTNAPVEVITETIPDTVWVSRPYHPIPQTTTIKPKPPEALPGIPDTAHTQPPGEQGTSSWYSDTLSLADSVTVAWSSHVFGTIDWFSIDFVSYPKKTTTVYRVVPCPPVQEPCKGEKSHLWAYGGAGATISPFKVVDVTGGLAWTYKRGWGLMAGGGYDWNIKSMKVEAKLLFQIK